MTYWELAFYFGYVLPGIALLPLNSFEMYRALREDIRRRASQSRFCPDVTYGMLVGNLLVAPIAPLFNICMLWMQLERVLSRPVIPRRKPE